MLILSPVDLSQNELRNAVIQLLASDPGSPVEGQIWYNTTSHVLRVRLNGTTQDLGSGGGLTQEQIEDFLGTTTLVGSSRLTVTYNDGAGTITFAVSGLTESDITNLGTATVLKSLYDANTVLAATTDDTPAPITMGASTILARLAAGNIVAATPAQLKTLLAVVAADISDFNTAVRTNRLDQMAAPTASVAFGSQKITSLLDGTAATDAATKGQLDAAVQGIRWKAPVRAATTAAGTLATSFENTDVIDGVTLATGDRILIKDQAAGAENGIYTVNASGAPTRATDADANAEMPQTAVWVQEGTVNADQAFVMTNNGAITLGTTALVFVQFSGLGQVTSGAGLTKTGNTLDVGAGTGISVAADTVGIDTAVVVRKFAASVGDGAALTYNVDHNLGTLDVTVEVFRNSDGVRVLCDVTHSTTNRVIVGFTVAPTSNQYRVVVHG